MVPKPKLRGAIVGAGQVAVQGHAPGWRLSDDVEIVGAADPRPEAQESLEAALGGRALAWSDSVERLLDAGAVGAVGAAGAAPLDFVDVCTPPAFHAAAIRAALERGIHVLCEKPLVLDEEELSPLVRIAERGGLVLATVHNWKFAPPVVAATELLRSGAIGRIRRCRWEVVRQTPAASSTSGANWRLDPRVSGGGILVDHGWHALYVMTGWIPGRLTAVSAELSTRKHRQWPVEDTAELRLELEGGVAEIFLTWAGEERRNTVLLEGERGTIRIEGRRIEVDSGAGPHVGLDVDVREVEESLADGSHHPTWFAGVADELVSSIRSPEKRPAASLRESQVCLEALRLARESSRGGGRRATPARKEGAA